MLCVLWARSYWINDFVRIRVREAPSQVEFGIASTGGAFFVQLTSSLKPEWLELPLIRYESRPMAKAVLAFLGPPGRALGSVC
jgi:hypothetical protein